MLNIVSMLCLLDLFRLFFVHHLSLTTFGKNEGSIVFNHRKSDVNESVQKDKFSLEGFCSDAEVPTFWFEIKIEVGKQLVVF